MLDTNAVSRGISAQLKIIMRGNSISIFDFIDYAHAKNL